MLVLTRRPSESIYIGADTRIRVLSVRGALVRLFIEAPDGSRVAGSRGDLRARDGFEPGHSAALFEGDELAIGDSVRITVKELRGVAVRLGVEAPDGLAIFRGELHMERAPSLVMAGACATLALGGPERVQALVTYVDRAPAPARIESWVSAELGAPYVFTGFHSAATVPRGEYTAETGAAEVWRLDRRVGG